MMYYEYEGRFYSEEEIDDYADLLREECTEYTEEEYMEMLREEHEEQRWRERNGY